MKRLVFATNNKHKLEEARAIMGNAVQLVSLEEIGCHDDIPETSETLEGNALQKAHYVHSHYGVSCIADDTGLMVDALGGAPGVYSARYAGPGHDSKANMAKLLDELKDADDRSAHFSTILAYVSDDEERTFEGRVDGTISREPSGNAGFGYDPVFVAQETGKSFADMSAEAKNAISHRGRAFRLFRDWFAGLMVIVMLMAGTAAARADQWIRHASYNGNASRVIDTPKHTYFLLLRQRQRYADNTMAPTCGALYRYDKEADEWQWLDRSNLLSEDVVATAAYDYKNNLLCVGYDNGNIDILSPDGRKVNIPGLMMAGANASTEIKSINVDPDTGNFWIATASGYVQVNPRKGEVVSSRDFGQAINSVAKYDGKLYVASTTGLYAGDERMSDLSRYEKIPYGGTFKQLIYNNGNLWAVANSTLNHLYYVRPVGTGSPYRQSDNQEYSIEASRDGLLVSGAGGMRMVRGFNNAEELGVTGLEGEQVAGSVDGKSVWICNGRNGMTRMERRGGGWTVTYGMHFPNASNAYYCIAMAYSPKYGMLVRNHGRERTFFAVSAEMDDLISAYKDGTWTPKSMMYSGLTGSGNYSMKDPSGIAFDPRNPDQVYCGSMTNGILRLDLEDPSRSIQFSRDNEPGVGTPGFVTVERAPDAWKGSCNFSAPMFDNSGIMWTSYYNPDTGKADIRYWTAEDRAATKDASSYRPMKKLSTAPIVATSYSMLRVMTSSANKNILVFNRGNYSGAITVINHGGTLDSGSDDQIGEIVSFCDQDGNNFDPGFVAGMWEDPQTGRVWVFSSASIFHFSPQEVLRGNRNVYRIKVARNDGTNLADYLLDGTNVTCMTADGDGRKWFGTLGAGIVVTTADGREIVKTYTTSNSDIPANEIYGLGYNPESRSMMVSTSKSLCEVFPNAIPEDAESEIRAYPNPVRPEYLGNVHIDCLPDRATVKITDSNNQLIKELGYAFGGEVEWNLTNYNNKRVPSGIYYVLATSGPDMDKYSKVTQILVVN